MRYTVPRLTAVLVLASVPLGAQSPQSPSTPTDVSVGTNGQIGVSSAESPGAGRWNLHADFVSKGDPVRPVLNGMPNWRLGVRVGTELFGHVQVGAGAIATRGHVGPVYSSQELGTGRDVSVPSRLASLGTSGTVWNTALTVAVPLKTTGRLTIKAVGEVWNPFGAESRGGGPRRFGTAVRAGIVTSF